MIRPGDLLDLPRRPSESFPADPYGSPGARAQALAAARRRADAYLDGTVTRLSASFQVELVLRRSDGSALATSSAQAEELGRATLDAIKALDPRVLPHAKRLSPERQRWSSIEDLDLAIYNDRTVSKETCSYLFQHRSGLGATEGGAARFCQSFEPSWIGSLPPPRLDLSTPATTTDSAMDLVERGDDPKRFQQALDAVDRLIAAGVPPLYFAEEYLMTARALLLVRLGKRDQAYDAVLRTLEFAPWEYQGWNMCNLAAGDGNSRPLIARAASAWVPEQQDWWSLRAYYSSPQEQVRFARRAFELDRGDLRAALSLGRALLKLGQSQEARAIAVGFSDDREDERELRAYLLGRVDLSEGRIGAGVARLRESILARIPGHAAETSGTSIIYAMDGAAVLGRDPALADEWVTKYVLPGKDDELALQVSLQPVIPACMRASPAVAKKCVASLRSHFDPKHPHQYEWSFASDVMLEALEASLRGDRTAAAASLRRMRSDSGHSIEEVPNAFIEATGAHDLAAEIDEEELKRNVFAGLAASVPRVAERAFRRGDTKRARELALEVVDKWGNADVVVPAVAEMRALLTKLR